MSMNMKEGIDMRILSVKYSENPVRLKRHYHDGHQILYVASGEVTVTVDGETYRVSGGSLVILSRLEEHSIQVKGMEYKRYTLCISSEPSAEFSDEYLLSSVLVNRSAQFRHVVHAGDAWEQFEKLLSEMVCEFDKEGAMREEMLGLYLKQFFITLYRCAPELFLSSVNRNTLLIREVQSRLEKECGQPFSLASLAEEYHVSVSYFSHLFKDVTGYAPIEYLMLCRLSAAKRYLCETDLAIREIVDLCGFGDESNFSRMFKAKTAMTPTVFRQTYRK